MMNRRKSKGWKVERRGRKWGGEEQKAYKNHTPAFLPPNIAAFRAKQSIFTLPHVLSSTKSTSRITAQSEGDTLKRIGWGKKGDQPLTMYQSCGTEVASASWVLLRSWFRSCGTGAPRCTWAWGLLKVLLLALCPSPPGVHVHTLSKTKQYSDPETAYSFLMDELQNKCKLFYFIWFVMNINGKYNQTK